MPDRRALTLDRRTQAMGVVAVSGVLGHRRGRAGARVAARLGASCRRRPRTQRAARGRGTATLETLAVVREGYKAVSDRENAVFNLLASFTVTFGITRATTALIRSGQGPRRLARPR